jgi:RNA polymerase sigma factor (TIGR02999 family)
MKEVTRILSGIDQGDPHASEELLALVYEELRELAAQKLAREKPGQTLQPTALVHEAYIRLVAPAKSVGTQESEGQEAYWQSRGHFFAAAAEAMRRILVERARRHGAQKRGGGHERVELHDLAEKTRDDPSTLLALDEALAKLQEQHPQKAQVVKLRFFAGCSLEETAQLLGISRATAQRNWAYARAWLFGKLKRL